MVQRLCFGVLLVILSVTANAQVSGEPYTPRVLAHVCTWLVDESWSVTTTRPLRGPYRSINRSVIESQLVQMKSAGVAPLVSWVGPNMLAGDGYLDLLMTASSSGVPAAILYEGGARLQPDDDEWIDFDNVANRERFAEDMRHLYERYFSRYPERFVQEDGRFVIVLWPSHIFRGSFASLGKALMAQMPLYFVSTDLLTRAFVRPDARDIIGGFAAVSAYGVYLPEIARELGGVLDVQWLNRWQAMADTWNTWLAIHEPQVRIALPLEFAFDDHLIRGSKNPMWLTDYSRAYEMVTRARDIIDDSRNRGGRYLPWTLAASWNEYFEGSAIEPNDRHGTRLLDILRDGFRR